MPQSTINITGKHLQNWFIKFKDESLCTAGIFVDLLRAFDYVDNLIVSQLYDLGFNGNALKLIKSNLTDKEHRTVIYDKSNRKFSKWYTVKFGVPQESVMYHNTARSGWLNGCHLDGLCL